MYDPRPISDQRSDKKAIPGDVCFFYFRLAPETLNCQILSAALSRTTTNTPSIYQIATSSSIIIAFEELNDEGSDTVFLLEYRQQASPRSDYTQRQSVCEPRI